MGDQIFGTPPEPLFNHNTCSVTSDLLGDLLHTLMEKNSTAVESAVTVQGSSFISEGVQFLFYTCEKLRMPPEVKYLGLELFDRFMLKHIQDLHEHVLKSSSKKSRGPDWSELMKRVENQVVLRVVSCLQIASKLTSHYRILIPSKAKKFLLETGHKYNMEGIMQSELRILKTLNFLVSIPSALFYLETILELLGKIDSEFEVKVLHGVSQKLLDIVYLNYMDIYNRLHLAIAQGSPLLDTEREKFAHVRGDKMLLMVAVVTAAVYIVNRPMYEKVQYSLSSLTKIPYEDITEFSMVIIQTLLENSED